MARAAWSAVLLGAALVAASTSTTDAGRGDESHQAVVAAPLRVLTNLDAAKVTSVLQQFRRESNVVVEAGAGSDLKGRLGQEQRPVDLALFEGVAYLEEAVTAGLITSFESVSVRQNVPYALRSQTRGWVAVSYVVRGLVSHAEKAVPRALPTIWSMPLVSQDVVCLPPPGQPRSQDAVADALRHLGPRASTIVGQWVRASHARFSTSESDVIASVAAGRCAVGLAHSDAIAAAHETNRQSSLRVSWPTGDGEGAPILMTGIAMTRHYPHYDRATALIEWLASNDGQRAWTATTLNFPANQRVRAADPVLALGAIPIDAKSPQTTLGMLIEAQRLSLSVGYR